MRLGHRSCDVLCLARFFPCDRDTVEGVSEENIQGLLMLPFESGTPSLLRSFREILLKSHSKKQMRKCLFMDEKCVCK